jgi:hypothetical protein
VIAGKTRKVVRLIVKLTQLIAKMTQVIVSMTQVIAGLTRLIVKILRLIVTFSRKTKSFLRKDVTGWRKTVTDLRKIVTLRKWRGKKAVMRNQTSGFKRNSDKSGQVVGKWCGNVSGSGGWRWKCSEHDRKYIGVAGKYIKQAWSWKR